MKTIVTTLLLALSTTGLIAQRFVFVDSDYILEKIPEYQDAQKKLDAIAEQWKQEIEAEYDKIDEMYRKYQAEQYLMDEKTKAERENEIMEKEKAVKELRKQRFGFEGDLFKKRQELVKPIQDKVFDAIKDMAESKGYDFVFDKANGGPYMLYANPRYDKSDDILKALGY